VNTSRLGFTLIELLIVVAIIAILAAIAVPNFLEAQTRSKVSRTKADMRSLATGLESYRVDNTKYPIDSTGWAWYFGRNPAPDPVLYPMTTPVAYMTAIPRDIFQDISWGMPNIPMYHRYASEYSRKLGEDFQPTEAAKREKTKVWALASHGPDRIANEGLLLMYGEQYMNSQPAAFGMFWPAIYDPTNGTISAGDIVRVGP
jgi:type II secretion system protein G